MKKIILIVDDESSNIGVLKGLLENIYIVRVAKNGKDALTFSTVEPRPDLILLDIMMPEMDGYEVCQKLKANPYTKNIPVIFVTTMQETQDETKGFDLGAVDYITKPVSPAIVHRRVATHLSLVKAETLDDLAYEAIKMLGEAGHYNDNDTGEHIWRMAAYAGVIARRVGWSDDKVEMLELAAPMHDTGKIGIPDSILKFPGKLNSEQWETMMSHSQIGYDIISKSNNSVFTMAAEIALYHHEKWDGAGYPEKLSGEAIPESARIVALADVFDALTMKRPYKDAWSVKQAFDEIEKCKGTHFDLKLVNLFLSIEDEIRAIKIRWD